MYTMMSTVTEYAAAMGVSATVAGFVSGIYVFGGLFSRLFSGPVMKRFGWKNIAVIFGILHFGASCFYMAADSAAMRAAKYAASGLIPIVGTTVAGAISTLAAGLSYARGIIGGGAIAVIVYLALSPLVLILLYRLALSIVVIFADFTGAKAVSRMLSAYRFALDMTLSAYSLSALIYVFLIIVFLRIGVDVI